MDINTLQRCIRRNLQPWPTGCQLGQLPYNISTNGRIKIIRNLTLLIYIHHHHHVVPPARISLILSRHFSLSFIVSGRSSGLHPVSSHSCCMYVRAGRPAFAPPYVGVHRSTSLMSSYLLLPQCPGFSNLYSFRDGRQVAVYFVPCGVLPPGLVQYCSQHSCVIAVQLLLEPFS